MKQRGYEVIGAFMKNWSESKDKISNECTWRGDRRLAMEIANLLDIKLITLDFEKTYRKEVVDEMFKMYRKGITPNPDIDCNNKVKFPLLWKEAKKLGCKYIVTGHYARIKKKGDKYLLLRAKQENKDQSYFLYRLTREDLSRTLFPIGDSLKEEVREIARKNKFPNYNRKSTVGICFIGKVNLKDFLSRRIKKRKGEIVSNKSQVLGEHDGVFYYTIGQRLGMRYGIDIDRKKETEIYKKSHKWYIYKKDIKKNIIYAAPENSRELFRKEINLKKIHFIGEKIKKSTKVFARIRKVGELLPARLIYKNNKYKVILNKAIDGVSEGQACVLYRYNSDEVLGGGVISG
jgi:tRNA-specific 2-thiouridylase